MRRGARVWGIAPRLAREAGTRHASGGRIQRHYVIFDEMRQALSNMTKQGREEVSKSIGATLRPLEKNLRDNAAAHRNLLLAQARHFREHLKQTLSELVLDQRLVLESRFISALAFAYVDPAARHLGSWVLPALGSEVYRCTDPAYRNSHPGERILRLPECYQEEASPPSAFGKWWAYVTDELVLIGRAIFLSCLFTPLAVTAPLALHFYPSLRPRWVALLRWTLEMAGPAFIKWGQWASSRPDLLPRDICTSLAGLHCDAPSHKFAHTRRVVEKAFGRRLEHLFAEFDEAPVASGSIAQIHSATLNEAGAALTGLPEGTKVAVKVLHPGVTTLMERDFHLMERVAAMASRSTYLEWMRLEDSIKQFGAPMREQLDLALEAESLRRFNEHFRRWRSVSFPVPLYPLVATAALVESFCEGSSIVPLLEATDPGPFNKELAQVGLNSYLQMLLRDNWVHADLHPGNLLVTVPEIKVSRPLATLRRLASWNPPVRMVFLDVGMTVELEEQTQRDLVDFFRYCAALDGEHAARSILRLSNGPQTCANPEKFVTQVKELYDGLDEEWLLTHASDVFMDVMDIIRTNRVNLSPKVSSIVISTFVLEGWANKLDPNLRILETLREMLPQPWAARMPRAVDRVMRSWGLPT
ncbi:unnamed protein product [Pedinophyceae sp. YPF-701]|nr:unnamed protein product [Pedinophyceae sp. YPF-701]